MAVNSKNHLIVVGDGGGGSFPLQDPGTGAYFDNTRSGTDGLITRFDSRGRVLWSTYFGGSGNDYITAITLAEDDNFWITGYTRSSDFPTQWKSGAYNDGSLNNFQDWFIAKFDSSGKLLYSTYYGGSSFEEEPTSIAYSPSNGHVAICGSMENGWPTYNPGNGAYTTSSFHRGLILQLDSTGQRLWAARIQPGQVAFDSNGNLFYVYGTAWPHTYSGSVPLVNPGGSALYQSYPSLVNQAGAGVHYFAKFDLNYVMNWGTCAYQGANASQVVNIYDIAIDQNDNLVAVGRDTHGMYRVNPGGFYQGAAAGGFDGTLAVFDNSGVPVYDSYYGGSGSKGAEDYLYTIDFNSSNEYLIGGVSRGKTCQSQNITTRNPGNAFYDGIATVGAGSSGALLPLISRFSPATLSGTNNDCVENFQNATFPVEWLTIDAQLVGNGNVQLVWTTASEINNHYFEVERAVDSRSFQKVGRIYGQGDAETSQTYPFEDQDFPAGRLYYRIKQVDLDGTYSYSPTVEVLVTDQPTINVVTEAAAIAIHSDKELEKVECWSITGTLIGSVKPQSQSYRWTTAHLPAGIYLLKVHTREGLLVRKVQVR